MNAESVARSGPAFELSFVDGRAVIGLKDAQDFGPFALESLELEIPSLRFPVDLSGGVRLFRHRRCALRAASLEIDLGALGSWLEERLHRPDGLSFRLRPPRVLHDGTFELDGVVHLGEQSSEFLFRGRIDPLLEGALRLRLLELRLFAPFALPAPLVAHSLLRGLAGSCLEGNPAPFSLSLAGCCELELHPLALALLHTLVPAGWRMPTRDGTPLLAPEIGDGVLRLRYTRDEVGARSPRPGRYLEQLSAGPELFAEQERLLLSAPSTQAREAYCGAREAQPQHPFAAERALALEIAAVEEKNAPGETLEALLEAIEESLPDLPGLPSARAIVALRQGDSHAAAKHFRRQASLAATRGYPSEELLALRAAGRASLDCGEGDLAQEDYQRVLALEPDDREALSCLGRLYAESGAWSQLVSVRLRQVEVSSAPEARLHALLALGELYRVHLGDAATAHEYYAQALTLDGDNEPALRATAETCIDADRHEEALAALDKLCQLAAERHDATTELPLQLRVTSLLLHLRRPDDARVHLERALTLDASSPEARRRAAELALDRGEVEEAIEHLRLLLELRVAPEERLADHRRLAAIYLHDRDDLDGAADELERALALDELDVGALHLRRELADRRADTGLLTDTLVRLAEAAGPGPGRADALLELGALHAQEGRPREAEQTFARAIEGATDEGFAALCQLAVLYEQNDEPALAVDAWRRVVATPKGIKAPEAWTQLATAERRQEAPEAARDALREALALLPGDDLVARWELLRGVDEALTELRDDESRRALLEDELEPLLAQLGKEDERARALARIGELREDQGDIEGALQALEVASRLLPEDLELLARRADVHELVGDWASARQVLDQALAAASEDDDKARLSLRLGQVATQQHQERVAIGCYERALRWGLPAEQEELAWRRIVELHLRRGDPVAAAQAAEQAAASSVGPESRAEQLFRAAQLWLKSAAREEDARRCLRDAVERWPRHRRALDSLESLAKQDEDKDELLAVLRLKVEAAADQPGVQKALLVRLAENLVEAERGDDARSAIAHALGLDDGYLPALLFAARSARGREAREEMLAHYQRIAEVLPSTNGLTEQQRTTLHVEAHLALARGALAQGQQGRAEGYLETALASDPQHQDVLEALDALLAEQGRRGEQLEVKRRLAALADEQSASAFIAAEAELLLQLERFDEAIACLGRLLERDPRHEALEQLEPLLRQAGQRPRLLLLLSEQARRLAARGDDPSQTWLAAADLAAELGEADQRRDALRQAHAARPGDAAIVGALVEAIPEDDEELPSLLGQQLALQGDRPEAAHLLARLVTVLTQRDETNAAISALQDALRRPWAGLPEYRRCAELLLATGRHREAEELYRAWRRQPSDDDQAKRATAELWACRGLLQLSSDDAEREALAAAILSEAPGDPAAGAALASVLSGAGRNNELLGLLREQLDHTQDAGWRRALLRQLALCLGQEGRASEAASLLRSNIDDADEADLPALLAACRELGLRELELACLRRASALPPHDPPSAERALELAAALAEHDPTAATERLLTLLAETTPKPQRQRAARKTLELTKVSGSGDENTSAARLTALRTLGRLEQLSVKEQRQLAAALASAGEHREAAELAAALLRDHGPDPELVALQRRELAAAGEHRALAELLEAAAEQAAGDAQGSLLREAAQSWAQHGGATAEIARCLRGAAAAETDGAAVVDAALAIFASLGAGEAGATLLEELATATPPLLGRQRQARALCGAAELLRRDAPAERLQELLEAALERDGANLEAHHELVALARRRGDPLQLARALRRRGELAGSEGARDVLEAAELAAEEAPEEARSLLQTLGGQSRTSAERRREIDLWIRLGALQEAEHELLQLAQEAEHAKEALQRACGLAHQRGDAAAERRYLSLLARLEPGDSLLAQRLQAAYRSARDLPGLRGVLEDLAEHDRGARLALAELHAGALDSPQEAYECYRQLLDDGGSSQPPGGVERVQALEGLAAVCGRLGRTLEQAEHLASLREALPPTARGRRGELALSRARILAEHPDRKEVARAAARDAAEDLVDGAPWARALRLRLRLSEGKEALEVLQELLEAKRANDDELAELGRRARAAGEHALAIRAYRALLERDPNHRSGKELVGLLRQQGRPREAAELLEHQATALLTRGDAARAAGDMLLDLAALLGELGEADRRLVALRQAAAACPGRREIIDALLGDIRQRGDRDAQRRVLQEQLVAARGSLRCELLAELAALHVEDGRPQEATPLWEELLSLDPSRHELLLPLLDAAHGRRDLRRARELLGRAQSSRASGQRQANVPLEALAPRLRAQAALELDEGEDLAARELLRELLEGAPKDIEGWQLMSQLGRHSGDALLTGQAEERLAELLPEQRQRHLRSAADAYRGTSAGHDHAVALYEQLLVLCPADREAWQRLEALLRQRRDRRPLLELWARRCEQEPSLERLLELEILAEELGHGQRAEEALRRACRLDSGDPLPLERLVERLAAREAHDELRLLLLRRLDDEAPLPVAARKRLALRLAVVLEEGLGDTAGASEWLARARTADPDDPEPGRRLAALRRRLGDARGAAALLAELARGCRGAAKGALLAELAAVQRDDLGDREAAAVTFQAAFHAAPREQQRAAFQAVDLFAADNDAERALELLDALAAHADSPETQHARGRALVHLERHEEAREAYERAVAEPTPTRRLELGLLLRRLGDERQAAAQLAQAADDLDDPLLAAEAAHGCGRALASLGLLEAAKQRHLQATERDPAHHAAWAAVLALCPPQRDAANRRRALEAMEALTAAGPARAELRLQRAELARDADDIPLALELLEDCLGEIPEHPPTLEVLYEIRAAEGDWAAGAQVLRRRIAACHQDKRRAGLHRALGELLDEHLGSPQEALEQLRLACSLDGSGANRRSLLGLLERREEHVDAARVALDLADELTGEERHELRLRAARSYRLGGQERAAEDLFAELESLSPAPDSADTTAAAPTSATADDEPETIEDEVPPAQIVADEPVSEGSEARPASPTSDGPAGDWDQDRHQTKPLPRLADAMEELAAAEAWPELVGELRARAFASRDPGEKARLLLELGDVLENRLDRPDEAFESYEEAARLAPEFAGVLQRAADAAFRLQRLRRARELYDALWRRNPSTMDRAEVAYRRGEVYEALGYEATANHCYAEAISSQPDHRPALEARARLALYRDDPGTAIDVLLQLSRQVTAEEPQRLTELRLALGELYLAQGQYGSAKEKLEAVLALDQRSDKALRLLLAVYEQLGEHRSAADVAEQLAFQLQDPLLRASLLHHRAMLLGRHLGDEDEAINCLLKAYDISPRHIPTLWRLVDYYWREGDLPSVCQMGEDLETADALADESADTRLAALAIAFLADEQEERAVEMLRRVLGDPTLHLATLQELAQGLSFGLSARRISALAKAAGATDLLVASAAQEPGPQPEHVTKLLKALAS